jgi:large subunit ribosomal protein L6
MSQEKQSRIGKLPVQVPAGVQVTIGDATFSAKGPNGELSMAIPPRVNLRQEEGTVVVSADGGDRTARAMHGLTRTLVSNLVVGVSTGFKKSIEIIGVGYTVELKKEYLIFNLGYSHPIYYEVPEGLKVTLDGKTKLSIEGADRQLVGAAAAKIRSFRPPEPYKGKGVKYADEVIRRKEGKSGGR